MKGIYEQYYDLKEVINSRGLTLKWVLQIFKFKYVLHRKSIAGTLKIKICRQRNDDGTVKLIKMNMRRHRTQGGQTY